MTELQGSSSSPNEDEVFQRKLLMDGEGMGDARRIDQLYSSFIDWFEAEGQLPEEITSGYEKLMKMVDHIELRSRISYESQVKDKAEITKLKKKYSQIEFKIEVLKGEIADRKAELSVSKSIRQKKLKCHALAQIIAKQPDRLESQAKLQLMQLEIDALESQNDELKKKLDEREKHLAALLTSALELKNKLREELEEWEDSESD